MIFSFFSFARKHKHGKYQTVLLTGNTTSTTTTHIIFISMRAEAKLWGKRQQNSHPASQHLLKENGCYLVFSSFLCCCCCLEQIHQHKTESQCHFVKTTKKENLSLFVAKNKRFTHTHTLTPIHVHLHYFRKEKALICLCALFYANTQHKDTRQ